MAIPILTKEPSRAFVGDTVQWDRTDLASLYPASSWNLKYYFDSRNPVAQFVVAAVANGDTFRVTLAPANTDGYAVSDRARSQSGYYWVARAEHQSDGRIFTVSQGQMDWALSLAAQAAGGFDPRTWAETALDNLRAVLESRATSDQLSYTLGDRSLERMTPEQLKGWHAWLRQEVKSSKAELSGNVGAPSPSIRVQFSRGLS